ncbi:MAG: hypothetical protein A2288_03140 [Candidatus Moranbacteria bacterium RIFOXYA12_FULL_44_15]|nr:MAG: hypothetical protein A2288_03140 [Candidatus Moranbacteria bacterium RIFOXYA12_FULL_44_15]OGI35442.1 MAG: hypothetical protein A2259_02540 [Candidatus Moranbacteria bacterium RIFOXYA2_FULL_43_15]
MGFWNKKIINFEDRFFGLDLSDLSVKVFQMEKNGKVDKIRSFCSLDIPEGYIEDGRMINKEKVAEIIRDAVKKAGPEKINTRKVICSIPESKAFLRIISVPKIEKKEAGEAIKWEIEANIPLSVDQVYFDWQFLEEIEGKQNVLTVAVSREIIDDTVSVLEGAGLEVYGMEIESVASARSLIAQNSPEEGNFLMVDLGEKKTSFIITEGNIPYFTSSIPFSSQGITDVISKSLGVEKKEAEKIKISQGIEHSFENSSIFNSVKPLLENLSGEIEKTVDFYKSMSGEKKDIQKIIMCGGGSNLKGMASYLTTRLSREVVIGDPWTNFDLGNNLPPINKESSIRYSTAVGLALGAQKDYGTEN